MNVKLRETKTTPLWVTQYRQITTQNTRSNKYACIKLKMYLFYILTHKLPNKIQITAVYETHVDNKQYAITPLH